MGRAMPHTDSHLPHTTPSKMKRKYQKRKRRSIDDDNYERKVDCAVYPKHKVVMDEPGL